MKTAVVITTINDPTLLLRLYRKYASDKIAFFIIGDFKTPPIEFVRYYSPEQQKALPWACSELIGWNCSERRSIGFLEALQWGADLIIAVDDDNVPLASTFFLEFQQLFSSSWNGLQVDSDTGWFDSGELYQPRAPSRGYPIQLLQPNFTFSPVMNARVGVAQGVCLGDPDVSAITRIAMHPEVHSVSELLRVGVTVPPGVWTVFNSQNTAVARELIPAWFMWPGLGRDFDIFASLVCQRIMREKGYVTHFGKPFVWQQRNEHDLVKDLHSELVDYDHLLEFAQWLDDVRFPSNTKISHMVRGICKWATDLKWWPSQATEAGLAWCDDVGKCLP